MFDATQYQLLDFGDGRRLERFGPLTLDRPCPAAENMRRADLEMWQNADARFEARNDENGQWVCRRELPERWSIAHGRLRFELKRTDFGHLGVFPEQAENWDWLGRELKVESREQRVESRESRVKSQRSPLPPGEGQGEGGESRKPKAESGEREDILRVLNLFAYTGGSTLAAAACGAEVTHVDAARNIVAWARRNAELSGLAEAPIRWIVEDAQKFVKRELKRGRRYDAVILDPPSYGHGPRGEVWRLSKHLPRLLAMCAELTDGRPAFMLLTCHTPGYDWASLSDMMQEALGSEGQCAAHALTIPAASGAKLPSGIVVRWTPRKSPLPLGEG
jgi:23S rRNA (cytosine1962-C5)-methyltransferase